MSGFALRSGQKFEFIPKRVANRTCRTQSCGALSHQGALQNVPAEERERLMRVGFVEVRRGGILHHGSLLVAADEIDRIEDDIVHLLIGGHDRSS